MPETPLHMGPGLLFKSLLGRRFSLMIFGGSQILIDIEVLIRMSIGSQTLHGPSHTYVGALLIAAVAAPAGKYIAPRVLAAFAEPPHGDLSISWPVAWTSALIGTISHVVLDSIMHRDMEPFTPFDETNPLLGVISLDSLFEVCFYTAAIGTVIYVARLWLRQRGAVAE